MPDVAEILGEAEWLTRLARSLPGSAADADDVVQDTAATALRSPPDPDRPVRPWLRRVGGARDGASARCSWPRDATTGAPADPDRAARAVRWRPCPERHRRHPRRCRSGCAPGASAIRLHQGSPRRPASRYVYAGRRETLDEINAR